MTVLVVTAAHEGALYSPRKRPTAPIRIYSDRRVRDDIATARTGRKWRARLSRKEYRRVRKAALENARMGRV